MQREEIQKYFQTYRLEHLMNVGDSQHYLFKSFCVDSHGEKLLEYLQKYAWKENQENSNMTYLIMDNSDSIAAYFSIKCGLLFEPVRYEKINKEEQDIVDMLVDAVQKNDSNLLEDYMKSGLVTSDKFDELLKIAHQRVDIINETNQLQDKSIPVEISHPAIELAQFCRNSAFDRNNSIHASMQHVPLGMGLFWELIAPLVCEIAKTIGCEYLYLFAADNTDLQESQKALSLLQYYRNNLKFEPPGDLFFIKPYYDRWCWPLHQRIADIEDNRESIWDVFLQKVDT